MPRTELEAHEYPAVALRINEATDSGLIARADAVLDAYEHVAVDEADRVLVHTDVGFHNLAIDLEPGTINGIFDYEGAAWADRHHDFRYRAIRRDRVLLYNAACAVSFLAYRVGTDAEDRWCGRTLAEDLRWWTHAIAKALAN